MLSSLAPQRMPGTESVDGQPVDRVFATNSDGQHAQHRGVDSSVDQSESLGGTVGHIKLHARQAGQVAAASQALDAEMAAVRAW